MKNFYYFVRGYIVLILLLFFGNENGEASSNDTLDVSIENQMQGPKIYSSYIGLSYELREILKRADGSHYFDKNNKSLVNLFHTLGIKSIRIGGNSLDMEEATMPTMEDICYLFEFAKTVGAEVIYSVNLSNGNATSAAQQAKYIWDNFRDQLSYFAIGNEPGKHKEYKAWLRPIWGEIMKAMHNAAPGALFCAPDDNPNPILCENLMRDFGLDSQGPLRLITLHSYPAGCAFSNVGTAKKQNKLIYRNAKEGCRYLLSDSLLLQYSKVYNEMEPVFRKYPFRLSETNNYWYSGLKGASNAYATALWGIDYMYWWAWRGNLGMNFHNGDKVGGRSMNAQYAAFVSKNGGFDIRPLSYALKVFNIAGKGNLVPVVLKGKDNHISAYATRTHQGFTYITIINKDYQSRSKYICKIHLSDNSSVFSADYMLMNQKNSNIYALDSIRLGKEPIMNDGTWAGNHWIKTKMEKGYIILEVPMASALIVKLGTENYNIISSNNEEVQQGEFEPTWKSLRKYKVPEWFRDAKFGIWAHWGPQSVPEYGDWYAYYMYKQGSRENKYHLIHYGHPSQVGFKDLIHLWTIKKWNPDRLIKLYKKVGAHYFVALANHHDNFDLWNSKYHTWKSTTVGPHCDIVAKWAKAARDNGLPFGISIHASRAWSWYDVTEDADKTGPMKGVPYDGKLTKVDGRGKWWEGLDPQELYARGHAVKGTGFTDANGNEINIPDSAWCESYFDRTLDVINQIKPDLIYFDDTTLPLWPVSDAGLKIVAHYYNSNEKWHNGHEKGVVTAKGLTPAEEDCLVRDVERGTLSQINPNPWQTCTCLGSWHYDRTRYIKNTYKTAVIVVRMLSDIVSKNGNLLLSVPIRADGTIDDREEAILDSIADWMKINQECIFGTRPWIRFGEGPNVEKAKKLINQTGFNESREDMTPQDIRFTTKGKVLYAIIMKRPANGKVVIHSLVGQKANIDRVSVLGQRKVSHFWNSEGLNIKMKTNASYIPVVKITIK